MPISIGSNIASLRAQRALATVSEGQSRTFERLSSGLRINRASDDAAGLSVSASLNTGSRVYSQAQRNLSDGVSLLSIADGAASQLENILERQLELAELSANGVYSDTQRQALDVEFQALADEYNRIIDTTEFNGTQVFLQGNVTFQAGFGTAETLNLSLANQNARLPVAVTRVSVSSSGAETDANTYNQTGISGDGRYVVFSSVASTLVSGDSNGAADIFVRDTLTNTTSLVSSTASGTIGNAFSFLPTISADGRLVAFSSAATNLVAGTPVGGVFVKDLSSGSIRVASSNSAGVASGSSAANAQLSADGRYVVFESIGDDLVTGDTNTAHDIFRKDLWTGETVRVSTSSAGAQANGDSYRPSISGDGRFVVFESVGTNLVAGDTNSQSDVFMKDMVTGQTTRVSTSASGQQGNDYSNSARISSNGKYVGFISYATNLVAGDTNVARDAFVKDLTTGIVTRASTDSAGNQGNSHTFNISLSADGRFAAFGTDAQNLTPDDTNSLLYDVFVKDLLTGETVRVSKDVGGIGANGDHNWGEISANGRYVAFHSDSMDLVSGDTNSQPDIFVARSDGRYSAVDAPLVENFGLYVSSKEAARYALDGLTSYRGEVSSVRGNIGSMVSRFDVALATLRTTVENYTAAASRITDTDVAEESSQLIRQGILQNAASAVLAQANQQPALALTLVQG